jgi:hypothetical protein
MPRLALRPVTAIVSILGLVLTTSSGILAATSPTSLSGRVVTDGADPRAGVVVTLVEPASEKAYRSAPTDARGAFTIDAAPAGSYALVVEAPEGAFLASNNVQLAPGVNRPISLALKPGKGGKQDAPPPAPADAPPPPPAAPHGPPTWAKWVIAGGVIVGAAIIVNAVTKDDEASPAGF